MMKKIILSILILSVSVLVFSGCDGGNPIIPPNNTEDSNIPEPTEAISQKINFSIGGTIEVTDEESPIYGVKLIIPSMPSNKDEKGLMANITISYLDNPYAVELPDNQDFLRCPLTIGSDVVLETNCILEIPYTEDELNNAGASSNAVVNVYSYNYDSTSWEKIAINKKIHKDTSDIIELIVKPGDTDSPYACTILNTSSPSNLGLPQPGDLLYKLGSIIPWEKEAKGWRPGHVGIYVGEKLHDGIVPYNVIEALNGGVTRKYYNPISDFSGSAIYMGARQPESGVLTSGINGQRDIVVEFAEKKVGLPYAWVQSISILWGMLKGDLVKGDYGAFNCVGLAEKAYERAGINNFEGLVSNWAEGNGTLCVLPTCVLTPAEQYNKTVPAEGYNVSGKVSDTRGNGIPGVSITFELVSFNNYSDSFSVSTSVNGDWDCGRQLGREWNVTPQKNGYTFEPSSIKVKGGASEVNFTCTSEPEILTLEEIELIRKWGYGGDYVVRWPDGYVDVYDATGYSQMQTILNQWNAVIAEPVVFRLSNNPNSPVKVIFDKSLEEEGLCGYSNYEIENYLFTEQIIEIDPECLDNAYQLYLYLFNAVAGFNAWAEVNPSPFETWSEFYEIPDMIKTMVKALHKVPPGYYLGEDKGKSTINKEVKTNKQMGLMQSGNCINN